MEGDDKDTTKTAIKKESKLKSATSYALFLLFGIGTWLNLNGIWIELPLLIPRLPEGWALSPQLGMASNIANVGPLIIAIIRYFIGKSSAYEVPSICVIFAVGISVPLILSFTWFKQVYFLGQDRSMYLLILGFFLALVNCTSSVTYLPFTNHFDEKWLNIYFTGEALSSLIPALLGLLQGVGQTPNCVPDPGNSTILVPEHFPARFSVKVYLICLSIVMFASFIAFLFLWRSQHNNKKKSDVEKVIAGENALSALLTVNNDAVTVKNENLKEESFSKEKIIYLAITFWISVLLIGCIPSINSYSLNPYGAVTFHYVIILCQCCYPLVSFTSSVRRQWFKVSKVGIAVLTIVGTLACFYTFLTAFTSPCSPLVDHWSGKYIIGLVWALVYLIFYYERVVLGNYFNKTSGHRGLFWYGFLTQAGALAGSLFVFCLTLFNVLKERELCVEYNCGSFFS